MRRWRRSLPCRSRSFILKGSAIGRSRAGAVFYAAIHAWMHRIPGGLGIANVFARAVCCHGGVVAGDLLGRHSAQARLLGRLCGRNYCGRQYAWHFAAAVDYHDPLCGAAEQSLGRLFLAPVGPALLLVFLFAGYTGWRFRFEYRAAVPAHKRSGATSDCSVLAS
jgi:C4-dicarboxylate transporter, DctM subunit